MWPVSKQEGLMFKLLLLKNSHNFIETARTDLGSYFKNCGCLKLINLLFIFSGIAIWAVASVDEKLTTARIMTGQNYKIIIFYQLFFPLKNALLRTSAEKNKDWGEPRKCFGMKEGRGGFRLR